MLTQASEKFHVAVRIRRRTSNFSHQQFHAFQHSAAFPWLTLVKCVFLCKVQSFIEEEEVEIATDSN